MREIVIDTETTGLDAKAERVVEIGCVEVVDFIKTGRTYHTYINPQKEVPKGAERVHGLTYDFLKRKPTFKRVAASFLEFIGDAPLVAHNIGFDVGFLNAELDRMGLPALSNPTVDTLALSRQVKPGGVHNLDAMCRHFKIDLSKRTKHGALIDAEILADLYLELRGGRQFGMALVVEEKAVETVAYQAAQRDKALPCLITADELAAHAGFVEKMGEWTPYLTDQRDVAA